MPIRQKMQKNLVVGNGEVLNESACNFGDLNKKKRKNKAYLRSVIANYGKTRKTRKDRKTELFKNQ